MHEHISNSFLVSDQSQVYYRNGLFIEGSKGYSRHKSINRNGRFLRFKRLQTQAYYGDGLFMKVKRAIADTSLLQKCPFFNVGRAIPPKICK